MALKGGVGLVRRDLLMPGVDSRLEDIVFFEHIEDEAHCCFVR